MNNVNNTFANVKNLFEITVTTETALTRTVKQHFADTAEAAREMFVSIGHEIARSRRFQYPTVRYFDAQGKTVHDETYANVVECPNCEKYTIHFDNSHDRITITIK